MTEKLIHRKIKQGAYRFNEDDPKVAKPKGFKVPPPAEETKPLGKGVKIFLLMFGVIVMGLNIGSALQLLAEQKYIWQFDIILIGLYTIGFIATAISLHVWLVEIRNWSVLANMIVKLSALSLLVASLMWSTTSKTDWLRFVIRKIDSNTMSMSERQYGPEDETEAFAVRNSQATRGMHIYHNLKIITPNTVRDIDDCKERARSMRGYTCKLTGFIPD